MTTWDLVDELGGDAIDEALRRRAVTLAQLSEALELTAGRRGNVGRHRLLVDSRDEPWSGAERMAHRILRDARFRGWRTNHRVEVRRSFVDHDGTPRSLLTMATSGRLNRLGIDRAYRYLSS